MFNAASVEKLNTWVCKRFHTFTMRSVKNSDLTLTVGLLSHRRWKRKSRKTSCFIDRKSSQKSEVLRLTWRLTDWCDLICFKFSVVVTVLSSSSPHSVYSYLATIFLTIKKNGCVIVTKQQQFSNTVNLEHHAGLVLTEPTTVGPIIRKLYLIIRQNLQELVIEVI